VPIKELFFVKIWITDGSGAPFGDIAVLPASHPGMLGGDIRYKGALDESVPVGEAIVVTQNPADCLVPEAEWCICFPDGTDAFTADPDALTASTPVVIQGMIEGKWLNRIGHDLTFKPASMGNNVLAAGPGIPGTLADLEDGQLQGEIRVQYPCWAGRQVHTADLSDLRGHNVLGLARAVFGYCREHGLTAQAVNCSARGPASSLLTDHQFVQQAMTAAKVTPADLGDPAAWSRLMARISEVAIDQGLAVVPGTPIDLAVTTGADTTGADTVGRGQLTVK
jgi:hypothetical protein